MFMRNRIGEPEREAVTLATGSTRQAVGGPIMSRQPIRAEFPNQEGVEYRPIEGWPDYLVGNDGMVWSRKGRARKDQWRLLVPFRDDYGYRNVTLCRNGIRTNRAIRHLVLETFVGPCPAGMEACHGPNGRADDSVGNLTYGTRAKNMGEDRLRDGTLPFGDNHRSSKLTSAAVL